jgi:hypothetical protein
MQTWIVEYVGPFIFGFLFFLAFGLFTDARVRAEKRLTWGRRLGLAVLAGVLTIGLGKILH